MLWALSSNLYFQKRYRPIIGFYKSNPFSISGLFSPTSELSSQDDVLQAASRSDTSYLNSARYISEGATWWAWLFEVKADGIVGGWSCFLSYSVSLIAFSMRELAQQFLFSKAAVELLRESSLLGKEDFPGWYSRVGLKGEDPVGCRRVLHPSCVVPFITPKHGKSWS